MQAKLTAFFGVLFSFTVATAAIAQPKQGPSESKCFPVCRAGFQCNESAQCVAAPAAPSACFPECRAGFSCDGKNACVPDGSAKPAGDASTAAAPSGDPKVTIESYADAEVLVDGGVIGRVSKEKPLVATLPIGKHSVRLSFDKGGADAKKIYVQGGAQQPIVFVQTSSAEDADRRRGKLAFGVGGGLELLPVPGAVFIGAVVFGTLSYGLGAVVDVQTNAALSVLATTGGLLWPKLSLEPKFLFHLGNIYTMSAGLRLGVGPIEVVPFDEPLVGVEFGGRISLLGFQFGEDRQHRIESTGQGGFVLASDEPHPMGGVDFRYSIMFP